MTMKRRPSGRRPRLQGDFPAMIKSDRLRLCLWDSDLADKAKRTALEAALHRILTPGVTRHLPETMQLGAAADAPRVWIDARRMESQVLLIRDQDSALIGLILLAPGIPMCSEDEAHIGYLLAQQSWGKGVATEALQALILWLSKHRSGRLVAGVDSENAASARVLGKLGFKPMTENTPGAAVLYSRDLG
ncbi:GNAT family N-acetyltransferase [Silicimonas sp. MF1-12-2]|uniref:GNAT family N-acetyltransferase n=1 Tax=Silicimonas sp. MF1-12-2 TaxID=3384793 RepID=UPI0039B4AE93